MYILEERLDDPSVCDMDELRSCVRILTNKGTLNPKSTPIHLTPKYGSTIDLARQLPSKSPVIIVMFLFLLLRGALLSVLDVVLISSHKYDLGMSNFNLSSSLVKVTPQKVRYHLLFFRLGISWTIIDESYLDYCITSRVRTRDWKAFLDDLGLKQFLAIEKKQVKLHRKHMVS